jgi:hypothetical protein
VDDGAGGGGAVEEGGVEGDGEGDDRGVGRGEEGGEAGAGGGVGEGDEGGRGAGQGGGGEERAKGGGGGEAAQGGGEAHRAGSCGVGAVGAGRTDGAAGRDPGRRRTGGRAGEDRDDPQGMPSLRDGRDRWPGWEGAALRPGAQGRERVAAAMKARRTAFMRVWSPGPWARNQATMSASRRRERSCLGEELAFGEVVQCKTHCTLRLLYPTLYARPSRE